MNLRLERGEFPVLITVGPAGPNLHKTPFRFIRARVPLAKPQASGPRLRSPAVFARHTGLTRLHNGPDRAVQIPSANLVVHY